MRNEVSTSPICSIYFSPNVYHDIKGIDHQKYTLRSLTNFDQNTPKGKLEKGNNDDQAWQKANKQTPTQTQTKKGVEIQPALGCKIKFLVGYQN